MLNLDELRRAWRQGARGVTGIDLRSLKPVEERTHDDDAG